MIESPALRHTSRSGFPRFFNFAASFGPNGYRNGAAVLCGLTLIAGCLLSPGNVMAAKSKADSESSEGTKAAKPEKVKKAEKAKTKAIKIKTMSDSSESRAERIARLRRECLGAVNAGACEGYTR